MTNPFQRLRRAVIQAVEEQCQTPQLPSTQHLQVLAEFLGLQLIKLGMSEDELARQLDWPEAQVRLLLDGTWPRERLTDDLLRRIGETLQCDVALMEIILDRPYAQHRAVP